MVEPTRRAAPLALIRPAKPPAPSKLAAGTVLALPAGHVAGDLRFLGIDRRRCVATYELRIANETAGPLLGFAYPIEAGIGRGTVSWSTIRVPARTSVAVPVGIQMSAHRPIVRVVAEIHGAGVHLTVDADPPEQSGGSRTRGMAGLAALLFLGVLGSAAYALEPRLAALVTGAASNQQHIAAGRAPAHAQPKRRSVALAKPLRVALDADTVEGGKAIVVRYDAANATGTVKLLDQDGTERASALLGKRGSSIVLAPKVEIAQDFRLVIDARHGTTIAETALPVRVVPAAVPVTAAKTGRGKLPAAALDDSPIALTSKSYRSGQSIVVTVARYAPNLELALMDDQGAELRKVVVRPEDKALRIEAPSVMVDARFVIVATFSRGAGQDSVIKPIVVRPR